MKTEKFEVAPMPTKKMKVQPMKAESGMMDEDLMIGQVSKKSWVRRGKSELTVDSAADESVCPKDRGEFSS